MKKLLIALILALGVTLGIAPQAIAHTPSGGATCDVGVFAKAENYSASDTNTISVQMDNRNATRNFGTDDYLVIKIPNDGVSHTWAWSVTTSNPDPAFSASDSGKIRCGDKPMAERAWFHLTRYCNAVRVEGKHNVARIRWHSHNGEYTFKAHAVAGALFGNGDDVKVKHAHVKRTGCGHGSGS